MARTQLVGTDQAFLYQATVGSMQSIAAEQERLGRVGRRFSVEDQHEVGGADRRTAAPRPGGRHVCANGERAWQGLARAHGDTGN